MSDPIDSHVVGLRAPINADEPLVWLLLVTLLWGMVFLVMLWHNSAVLWWWTETAALGMVLARPVCGRRCCAHMEEPCDEANFDHRVRR